MRSASAHLADNPRNYNPATETRLQRFHDGHEEVALLATARGTRGRKSLQRPRLLRQSLPDIHRRDREQALYVLHATAIQLTKNLIVAEQKSCCGIPRDV